jgi:transposase
VFPISYMNTLRVGGADRKETLMERMVIKLSRQVKRRFRRTISRIKDARLKTRYLIILHTAEGYGRRTIAEMLLCSPATVDRVRNRYRHEGERGLIDRRGDNGPAKVNEDYILALINAVERTPRDYGYRRPTWTQELLVRVLTELTGITVSRSTMSRLLRRLGVRRGMPKPTVGCPWPQKARQRRMRLIKQLIKTLPADQVAFYEDEIDIHLNPKIGPDYMLPGQQKKVLTPGKNVKHYVAGAMDVRTGRVIWVDSNRKRSALFIELLKKLDRLHGDKKVIHIILDNYIIHSSKITQKAVVQFKGRIVLHFLPPYCPDDNKIERCVWRDLHANVTRNHTCRDMDELMREVRRYLAKVNRSTAAKRRREAA